MNANIEVGATPVYDANVGLRQTAPLMAAFGVAGAILLCLAFRLCRRTGHARKHHADRFTVHRH